MHTAAFRLWRPTSANIPSLSLHSAATTTTISTSTLPNGDRKSTRLNSSHLVISYAVVCLEQKLAPLHALVHDGSAPVGRPCGISTLAVVNTIRRLQRHSQVPPLDEEQRFQRAHDLVRHLD